MAREELGLLDEHQSVDRSANDSAPAGYQPSEEEEKTIKLVNELLEKARKHRKQYDRQWLDHYKFFRGKQWKENRPSYRHSEVINMVFQSIQSVVPILTDAKPKFEFLPEEPGDRELAEILNDICEGDWTKKNWLLKLTEMIYEAHFYGAGMGSMEAGENEDTGGIEPQFKSRDPFYSFPDPDATDVNEESGFFIYAEPSSIEKLKSKYPDKKAFLKPDLMDLTKFDRSEFSDFKFKSPVDSKTYVETDQQGGRHAQDQALKVTCYIKSEEVIEEEQEEMDPATGIPTLVKVQRLKYPNGRRVVMASNVILEDGPNPYEDGKFPYFRLLNYILPREFWGMSEIEQLESPQKIFNKLVSFALDVLTLMGNPIWLIDDNSGIDEENLFNRPGLIVTKSAGSDVRRMEGVQLQPYVLQMIDRMKMWFDDISGSNDVTRGVEPGGGVTAASAIQSLQQAAQTRLRLKSRLIDACLQQMGQMWLSRRFQFSTAPEIVRLTNNQNAVKYFKFSISEKLDENGSPVLGHNGKPMRSMTVIRYAQNPETGEYFEQDPKEYQIKGKFDVKTSMGSSLPFAKVEKFAMAEKMYQMQAIDQEELLKSADWPNYEAVMERMKQKQMEQMQQQMAAQGGGMPPEAFPAP